MRNPVRSIIGHLDGLWNAPSEVVSDKNFKDMKKLVSHAIKTVPFYSELGIDSVSSWEEFKKLPIVTKSDIQADPSKFKSNNVPESLLPLYECSSSGSTGKPLTVLRTEMQGLIDDFESLHEFKLHGCDLSKKFAVIRAECSNEEHSSWGLLPDMIATGPLCMLNSSTDIQTQFNWILEQHPEYLMTFPTNLKELLKYSKKMGMKPESIKIVFTTGEPMPLEFSTEVENLWGVKVADLYSSQELGKIAMQCPYDAENYHVQADTILVEILNDFDEQCNPGEIGRVVVTNLNSYAMPLIRYENGDYAEAGTLCSCGCMWPTIKSIIGRERNMITLPNGSKHWPSFPSEEWIAIDEHIKQFQLVQHSTDSIEVKLVRPGLILGTEWKLEDKICHMLNRRFGANFLYCFTYFDALHPGTNGKFEDFISLIESE